ncbi:MAG TPA: SelB C-terminal domain-containing protein [Marmoricola sp.]|nr:SelB C-terminal domain-containing protein [Marmoricola sp.]
MHVVATAGHVDHGKSTLVQALTGQEPDRLEEEKRRGLSIRLGYCWTRLDPVGDVAFVDVPGHERFLATTLAGLGPAPVVMFVVAADDPWMPQAAEHLAALDALGVCHGLLVVTRCDLADPAPALAAGRRHLDGTSLAGIPAVTVSGRTGQGLDALRGTLAAVLGELPAPDPASPVRLWVDRRFHVRGTGTVVTGTLPAGTIRVGDQLVVGDAPVRVRHVESLQRHVDAATGPARVALDLGGRVPDILDHDSVLVTPGAFCWTRQLDVRLRGGGTPPQRPLLHVGAVASGVHLRPLADDVVRLLLDRPLPLRHGDRAVLRDPGDRRIWGVLVLDPDPPALHRRGAAARRARDLVGLDGGMATALRVRGQARHSDLARLGFHDDLDGDDAVRAGDWLLAADRVGALAARLRSVVASSPEGVTPTAAAQLLGLADAGLVTALVRRPVAFAAGRLVVDEGPSEADRRVLDLVRRELREAPFAAPDADRLRELGISDADLARLARTGHLLRPAPGIALLPEALDEALARLGALPQPFTASEARRALGTSRRVALPLLAHLDRSGATVRLADDRRRVRARAAAGAH